MSSDSVASGTLEEGTEVVRHVTQVEMLTGLAARRTDADGTLVRPQLPVGRLRVTVEAEDGDRGEGSVEVRAGDVADMAIEVE